MGREITWTRPLTSGVFWRLAAQAWAASPEAIEIDVAPRIDLAKLYVRYVRQSTGDVAMSHICDRDGTQFPDGGGTMSREGDELFSGGQIGTMALKNWSVRSATIQRA